MLCACGHEKSDHYQYCNNGKSQTRCRRCDPWVKFGIRGGGCFVVVDGSKFQQMDKAADHDFVESPARQN